MNSEAGATHPLYEARRTRIERAIRNQPVDRVPLAYMGMGFAPRYMGMSMADFCASAEDSADVILRAMDRLGAETIDAINSVPCGRIAPGLTILWLSHIAEPGRDLPDDALWQVVEAEVMQLADYDVILEQGWPAFLKAYLPRVIDAAELDAHRRWVHENAVHIVDKFRQRGYVPISFGATSTPFEYLCGGRSMKGFFLDLYRHPDKVRAVMDVMLPHMIDTARAAVRLSGIPAVWVGGWRSASALLAPKIWDEFVFPYLRAVVEALAAEDILSVLHLDQSWTRDLGRLADLPAGRCLLNPDGMTDIRQARALLGGRMAIMGDVPSPLLAVGTPEDIYTYVRELLADVGPTGLILCPGCDAPINARPENMEAMVAAGREFGRSAGAAPASARPTD